MARSALLLIPLLASSLAGGDPAAAADLRRVESVGAVPIQPVASRRQPPRDAAVRAAVARGVEGIAREILPDDWPALAAATPPPEDAGKQGPGDIEPELAKALGSNPFEYATRFRTLEDRGARDALFTRAPGVESEYVVVVEVFVDAGRVRERLREIGWISNPAGQDDRSHVRLVLEGVRSFDAYDALRRTLTNELDVSAVPVELSRGRAVLEVDGPYSAGALQRALLERAEEGLRVVPLEQNGQTLTLLVEWTDPNAGAPEPPADLSAEVAP